MKHVVVVGAGLAGLRSVEALRAKGYRGRITLLGQELHRPYDRPPLSKAVLIGDLDDTTIDTDLDALEVDMRSGVTATGLSDGVVATTLGRLEFDGLVIATGATPIRLPGEGNQHVLRTIDDALDLRDLLRAGAAVVVIGAGWIGAEVATAAAGQGCEVTVLEAADTPLAHALDPVVGAWTMGWYGEAGIELMLGAKVASVDHGAVSLVDGRSIRADLVVTGVGVRPAVGWLADSPITLENGVVTDEHLRTTLPGVVAVGDCAGWWSRRYGRRLRVEHWDSALSAPEVAAASLLGEDDVYDPVPYFWSEQFGRMVQYAGDHQAGHRVLWRGDPSADPKWAACWLTDDNTMTAILTVDRPRDLVQGRRLMEAGAKVDLEKLTDPTVSVRASALS